MAALKSLALLFVLTSCSSDAKPEKKAPPTGNAATKPTAATTPPVTSMLPDGPRTIEHIELPSIRRKLNGTTSDWVALESSEVTGVDYKELYQSRGESFVSFKGRIQGGEENCLVQWRAELIQSKTGRGPSLSKIEGTIPVPAGEAVVASGIVNLSPKIAGQVGSANVGYWKLCGDALPSPNVFDFPITESEPEQIKFGKSFNLHHTRLAIESKLKGVRGKPQRCTFEMVAEDVDESGYTLNRDFASFSMAPETTSGARIRRTTFEGGNENDYASLAVGKRSYLRRLACIGPWDAKSAEVEGLKISKLTLEPYTGKPTKAEHLVRATYGHSAIMQSTTGKDCSFRVRYRVLDKAGVPLNRAPVLSESIHLAKGATAKYESSTQRLFVWHEQADEVGALVVEQAAPIKGCSQFDASKALQASN